MRSEFGHGGTPNPRPNYNFNRVEDDVWIACHICDFAIPFEESVVHYKKGKYVCGQCADARTQSDMQEFIIDKRRGESEQRTPQRITDQG